MAQHNIEKWDPGYALLKPYVNLNFRGYFSNVYVRGKENLPRDTPLIFAPNHQNALMDALGVLYALPGQPVFLARSDIFKNPLVARILTFLKMLPIYRIRDGYGMLQENERIMQKVGDVLRKKGSLVIFPEGNHGAQRRLRPLKKGICRIALQSEQANNFGLGLQVVPVGLDYDNYYKFGHTLVVRFGRPVAVDPYQSLYEQNPSRAYIALKDEIARELRRVMIHIEDRRHHNLITRLRELYYPRMLRRFGTSIRRRPEKLEADRQLIRVCEEQFAAHPQKAGELERQVKYYLRGLDVLKLRPWLFNRKRYLWLSLLPEFIMVLLFFPLFLYGLVNNALPFFLPVLPTRKVRDPQFWSSIKNGLALVAFPLFYLIQTLLVAVFTHEAWMPWVYLVSLPLSGFLAYRWYVWWKKLTARLRYNLLWLKKPQWMNNLRATRKSILDAVDDFWEKSEHTST